MSNKMNTKEYEEYRRILKKIRMVTAVITAVVMLVLLFALLLTAVLYSARINDGEHLRREIAASTVNTELNGAVMSYYYSTEYNSFLKYYGDYADYFGLNRTLPLKDQEITEGVSWRDYFMSEAKNKVTSILAINEAAKVDGFALNSYEMSALSRRVDSADVDKFGNGINREDMRSAELSRALAYAYLYGKELSFMPDTVEIQERYDQDPDPHRYVDLCSFTFSWNEQSKADAEYFAAIFANAKNVDDFRRLVGELTSGSTADDKTSDILVTTGVGCTEGDEVSKWAFSAEVGDTYVKYRQDEAAYTVYMLMSAPYRREDITVNARHILLLDGTYESRGDTIKAAEMIVELFEDGDRTSEAFALLALEFSEDETTRFGGGYYGNIIEGETTKAFNDWCFSPERQPGDVGIIEGMSGCHIIYYEGTGLAAWQSSVARKIVSERLTDFCEAVLAKYPVLFDESVLDMISE